MPDTLSKLLIGYSINKLPDRKSYSLFQLSFHNINQLHNDNNILIETTKIEGKAEILCIKIHQRLINHMRKMADNKST